MGSVTKDTERGAMVESQIMPEKHYSNNPRYKGTYKVNNSFNMVPSSKVVIYLLSSRMI
jgi:hypothetical protein